MTNHILKYSGLRDQGYACYMNTAVIHNTMKNLPLQITNMIYYQLDGITQHQDQQIYNNDLSSLPPELPDKFILCDGIPARTRYF